MPSAAAIRRSTMRISSTDGRANANAWQRPLIVSSSLCGSVVQSTNTTWSGGSSSVFSSAFDASVVSECASSRM